MMPDRYESINFSDANFPDPSDHSEVKVEVTYSSVIYRLFVCVISIIIVLYIQSYHSMF